MGFKNKREITLVWALLIFAVIPIATILSIFPLGVPHEKRVNPNIVNGMITVSGLIFAFQPIIFKLKKKGFYRILFLAIFSVEGLILGLTGYYYALNGLNYGYLTGDTLELVASSLFFNISMSTYFVLVDFVTQTEEELKL
jgi:hypothetical protein